LLLVIIYKFASMKRLVTLFLCMIYTFVTLGGSIFVHNCGENTIMSFYEKASHDSCPICVQKQNTKKLCKDNSCKDIEVKIDQLSKELFSAKKFDNFSIQPAIFQRLWIDYKPHVVSFNIEKPTFAHHLYYTNNSPPTYILHRNIRN